VYLEGIVNILKDYRVDTSEIEGGPEEKESFRFSTQSKDTNPYDMPGGRSSRRSIGGGEYTGD
jgi:hypothetical protein